MERFPDKSIIVSNSSVLKFRSLADEVETLDLGVHTGFSSMTRDESDGLVNQNEDVLEAVERIRSGEFDYVAAWDDRRICRDEYFTIIQYACKQATARSLTLVMWPTMT